MGLLKVMMDQRAESDVLHGPKGGKTYGPAVPNPPKEYETGPEAITMLWEMSESNKDQHCILIMKQILRIRALYSLASKHHTHYTSCELFVFAL